MDDPREAGMVVVLERFETRNGGLGQRWVAKTEEGSRVWSDRKRETARREGIKTLRMGVYLMDFDSINWKVKLTPAQERLHDPDAGPIRVLR